MWPFRKRRKKDEEVRRNVVKRTMSRVVVGMIIGGAIGSIVGKTLLEEKQKQKKALGQPDHDGLPSEAELASQESSRGED